MNRSAVTRVGVAFLAILGCAASEEGGDLDRPRDAAFAPDPFVADDEPQPNAPSGTTIVLAELNLPDGAGMIRFLDHTADGETPSIAFVAVEPAERPSMLSTMVAMRMSPLEFFMWLQPGAALPEALQRDHKLKYRERGLAVEPRRFAASLVTQTDTWVPECGDNMDASAASAWATGFNAWSSSAVSRANPGWYNANVDVYAYFSTMDYAWAGLCNYRFGISAMSVSMEQKIGAQPYTTMAGTSAGVSVKHRYLYFGHIVNSWPRRIHIDVANLTGKFLLSGAWADELPM